MPLVVVDKRQVAQGERNAPGELPARALEAAHVDELRDRTARVEHGHAGCRQLDPLLAIPIQPSEHQLHWVCRKKKASLPPRANEQDRAKFARVQSYRVRKDDLVACKNIRCRKRFEISGVQSVVSL